LINRRARWRRNRPPGHPAARSALWHPDPADLGHPEVIARRNCAAGVPAQAAQRRPGEVAARRRCWIKARILDAIRRPAASRSLTPGTSRPARIPIRTPAVAATDNGLLRPNWPSASRA